MIPDERRFLVATDRRDDPRAERRRPLQRDQADSARGRVQQDPFIALHAVAASQQEPGGQTLQRKGRTLAVGDAVGQLHDARRVHDALLGVGAGRVADVGDAVVHAQRRDALPDLEHDARGFPADAARQRHRVEPAAVVGIDEVDADRGVADADLALADASRLEVLEAQDLGSTMLMDADAAGHVATIPDYPGRLK